MGLQETPGEARIGPHGSHGVCQKESGDTWGGQPESLGSMEGEVRNRSCHMGGARGEEVGGVLGHTKGLGGS